MKRAGFTLTEIALAIGIIATALVAILGLLPAGLNASRDAADSTVIATVLEDVSGRLKGQPLRTGPVAFSPALYDVGGHFITLNPEDPASGAGAIYRADVEILQADVQPANTSNLRIARISVSWPVNPRDGSPVGSGNPKSVVTFAVTPLTGPDWERIDRQYIPKVDL